MSAVALSSKGKLASRTWLLHAEPRRAPRAAQLPLHLPVQLLQDFSVFLSPALDFVTHATAAR